MTGGIRFVDTRDGVRIAYAEHGRGSALVLVRGWTSHLELMWEDDSFRGYFERVAEGRRLVRFDARGNGLSDRDVGAVDLDKLVLDLEAVMNGLEIDQAVLYGASYGAPIALAYTERYPERVSRLILDGGFARGADLASEAKRTWLLNSLDLLRDDPDAIFVQLAFGTDPEPDPAHPHTDRVRRLRRSITGEMALRLYTLLYEIDVTDLLPRIKIPVLVMSRRRSQAVPVEQARVLASRLRDATLIIQEGRHQNSWDHDPEAAAAIVRDFLDVGDEVPPGPPPGAAPGRHLFRREGDYWSVSCGDEVFRLKDGRGLRWIAELLARPGQEVHAAELVTAGRPSPSRLAGDGAALHVDDGGGVGPVLDATAKAAYRQRISELQEELDEAEANNDGERAARTREELDFVVHELSAAAGLGGRDRPSGSDAERARVNVTRGIRGAIKSIEDHCPDLGRHLSFSIRTGAFCSYVPDPSTTWEWDL